MKGIFSLLLLSFLVILQAQDTITITQNFVSKINLSSAKAQTLKLAFSRHQALQTLSLSFLSSDSTQSPDFTVSFSFNNSEFANICENPLANNHACFFEIPSNASQTQTPEILVRMTCYSPQCNLKILPVIFVVKPLSSSYPETESLMENKECRIMGFTRKKSDNFSKIILSIRAHNHDAHEIFPNLNLRTFFRFSSGKPSISLVADRIILIFKGDDPLLCSDCQINFLFCSETELVFETTLWNYSEMTPLTLNKEYIDYLDDPSLLNSYKLTLAQSEKLSDEQSKLFFTLKTFTGSSKSMYIHGDYQPRKTTDYQYKSTLLDYFEEEDIVLTKDDLVLSNFQGQDFYIAVNGNHPGLYKFETRISDSLIATLGLGMSEVRTIKAEELHYYRLHLWNTAFDDGYLLLKLTVESGNIEVYGRICSLDPLKDCPLLTPSDVTSNSRIDYRGDSKEGNKMLRFPSKCSDSETNCYLQFMVKGFNSTFLGLNRYNLMVTRENAIITLLENMRHDSHIELNNILRYKLSVSDPNNLIEAIKFRITAELPYYVTRNISCFEEGCAEKIGTPRNPVLFKTTPFSGEYFLFVKGLKSSDFSIYPEIMRKDAKILEIPLSEGKPFKGILNTHTESMIFSFIINRNEETDVEVILQGAKNKFEIELYNGKGSNFGWSSTTNLLQIRHQASDEELYRVIVKPLDVDLTVSSLEFSILFATDKTLRSLEKNKIAHETVKPLGFKYYVFYVDMAEETCIVTKHIITPLNLAVNLEMYISSSPYPEKNFFIYKADNAETSRVILKNEEILKLCANNSNPHHCPIYLSVYNSDASEEIVYSLLAHFQNKPVELMEGHEQRFVLNQNEEVLRGYFIPNSKNSTLDLYFYTENVKFEVFLSIFDDKDNLALSHHYFKNFPNKTSHLFYLHENLQTSQVIKPKSFDFCWPYCVLLFTVTYRIPFLTPEEESSLTILISSNFTELHEGKSLSFSLVQQEFKYFYFNLESFLKNPAFDDDSTLILSLTSFYGSADLFINVNNNMKRAKPTNAEADAFVYGGHYHISKSEIIKSLEEHISNATKLYSSAKLVVGVFSEETDGKFMLNIVNSVNALQSVYAGTPQEVFLRNNTGRYFQFYFRDGENFKVIFNRENGVGVVGMLACSFDSLTEDSDVFKTCSQKKETDFKVISGTGSSFYEMTPKNPINFCIRCYYLIHIRSISSDLKGSLVVSEGDNTLISLQEGHKFYDHLEKDEESRFVFWTSGYEVVEIIVTVIQGNPIVYYSPDYYHMRKDFFLNFSNKNSNNPLIHFLVPPKISSYGGSIRRDWELPDEWGQHSSNYLIVYANRSSEYSINFVTSGAQVLQGGLIHLDALRPMGTKTYLYSHAESITAYMTINFEGNVNLTDKIEFSAKFREFNNQIGFKANEVKDISLDVSFQSLNTIGFLIPPNKTGTFIFNLTSLNKKLIDIPYTYSIVVNSREISVVPNNTAIRTVIPNKNIRFYESYVTTPGFLVFELLECSGGLQVLMTKDYDSVLLEDFEEDFKPVLGQSFIHVMKVDAGMIYFALKSMQETSIVDFSLKFYESQNKIPQIKYSLSNQGILDSTFNRKDDTWVVNFGAVICEACDDTETQSITIKYEIMHSESLLALSTKGKCGVYSFGVDKPIEGEVMKALVGEFPLMITSLSATLKLESRNVNFVTLQASVMRNDAVIYDIYYPIIEIHPINRHPWVFWAIVGGVVVSLLTCCGLAVFFFRKYRHAIKKLRYEMEDVRNVAQITTVNTSIEMENKKYQGLAEA